MKKVTNETVMSEVEATAKPETKKAKKVVHRHPENFITKVGEFAKFYGKHIIERGNVEELCSREVALSMHISAAWTLFAKESDTIENGTRNRYYKEVFTKDGVNYVLCAQLFDRSFKPLFDLAVSLDVVDEKNKNRISEKVLAKMNKVRKTVK